MNEEMATRTGQTCGTPASSNAVFCGVVGDLPPGVYDRPFSHLDNAIAGAKARRCRGLDKVDVRPLKSVAVNVVSYLAEQYPIMLEDTVGFTHEWRESVGKVVAGLRRGLCT